MNELIAKLYEQAMVLEGNGDYVAGELDPVKFAELIVEECANVADENYIHRGSRTCGLAIKEHFGVRE